MTNELTILLDKQPVNWPRWLPGSEHLPDGWVVASHFLHLFCLEPVPGVPFPMAGIEVPVCRFVNGATFVEIGRFVRADSDDVTGFCPHCVDEMLARATSASLA